MLFLALIFSMSTFASTTICNANGCIITVDWAIDEEPDFSLHTCDYTQGAATFFPDTSGSGAGKCTIRRALREAGARSDSSLCPGCQPVLIRFTGLNGSDGNADDVHYNVLDDQWVLPVSDAVTSSAFMLKPQSITDVDGPILVRGPAVDVLNGEMPKIIIDSAKTLEVELAHVTIKNLGFMGGMSIHWKESDGIFENNTWGLNADGMSIKFADFANDANDLAGKHGIFTTLKGDNMLVQNNLITGASTYAIEINSGTAGVQILDNLIGTRIDGTVPSVPEQFKCRSFTDPFNPITPPLNISEWFGGAGISAAGTGLLIQGNTIVGLQNIRSIFDTPPEALTVFGALHTIEDNIIGQDINGTSVGVCGQGIKMSTTTDTINPTNNGHLVLNNVIDSSRNGFENTKGAILWSDITSASFLDGGNTIRGNLVINGPEKYFEVGPMLTTPIKAFEPAEITSISGVNISGGNDQSDFDGNPSPCPNCIIDFYLDDTDENEEALEHLGSTTADVNGDFSYVLSTPLTNGFGIRTTSTSTANDVIPHTWAGQTSEMSNVVYRNVSEIIFNNGFESP